MLPVLLSLSMALAGEPVVLGGPARAFALPTLNTADAQVVSLYDLVGLGAPEPHKAAIVHFFQPGQGDDALAELSRLSRKHAGLAVIGVVTAEGGRAAAQGAVQKAMPTFPVLYDEHGVVFSRYGVARGPFTVVLDADAGIAALGNTGDAAWVQDVEQVLAPLLGG